MHYFRHATEQVELTSNSSIGLLGHAKAAGPSLGRLFTRLGYVQPIVISYDSLHHTHVQNEARIFKGNVTFELTIIQPTSKVSFRWLNALIFAFCV